MSIKHEVRFNQIKFEELCTHGNQEDNYRKGLISAIMKNPTVFSKSDIDSLFPVNNEQFSFKKVLNWGKDKWDAVGTGFDYKYCLCGYTSYSNEHGEMKMCCDHESSTSTLLNGRYESIRPLLAKIFLNDELLDSIHNIGGRRINIDSSKSSIFNLNLLLESYTLLENGKPTTYYNAYFKILDFPPILRDEESLTFVSTLFKYEDNAPGYLREMLKVLMLDLTDLQTNGFKVTKNSVEYTLFVNLMSITSFPMRLPAILESNYAPDVKHCSLCKNAVDPADDELRFGSFDTDFQEKPKKFVTKTNQPITTEELRDAVNRKDFGESSIAKARSCFTDLKDYDFMNNIFPDLKQLFLDDLFTTKICALVLEGTLEKLDAHRFYLHMQHVNDIKEAVDELGIITDTGYFFNFLRPDPFRKYASLDGSNIFLCMSLLPLIFRDVFRLESNYGMILQLLLEFNHYMMLFFCVDVPIEDVPKLKISFKKLVLSIQYMANYYPFLDPLIGLSSHLVLHMFDKWTSIGSFIDTWCSPRYNNHIQMIFPFKSIDGMNDDYCREFDTNDNLQFKQFKHPLNTVVNMTIKNQRGDGRYRHYVPDDRKKITKLSLFSSLKDSLATKFGIEDPQNVPCSSYNCLNVGSQTIDLTSGKKFAKVKINGKYAYINIKKILGFNHENKDLLVIEYTKMKTDSHWEPNQSAEFEIDRFPYVTNLSGTGTKHWLWLDDDVDLSVIYVLTSFNNFILDPRPVYNCRVMT